MKEIKQRNGGKEKERERPCEWESERKNKIIWNEAIYIQDECKCKWFSRNGETKYKL